MSQKAKEKRYRKLVKKANRELMRGEGPRWEPGTRRLLEDLRKPEDQVKE